MQYSFTTYEKGGRQKGLRRSLGTTISTTTPTTTTSTLTLTNENVGGPFSAKPANNYQNIFLLSYPYAVF